MTVSLFAASTGDNLTREPGVEANSPEVVFEEIIDQIGWAIQNQPRDLQERIGPSEIGEPCERALIAKLAGLAEPTKTIEPPNFRAWVGTCMHAGFERILSRAPGQRAPEGPRYLLEEEVVVGTIGSVEITGHCDVFDTLTGTVVDHKSKSRTRMTDHRRHGAGPTYRSQAYLYGLGMSRRGYHVNTVMNIYYPRDGELHDAFFWSEPYNKQVALAALERANQLHALAALLGTRTAMAQFPLCSNEFCRWCGNWRAPYGAPKPVQTTLAGLMRAPK